MLKHSKIKIPQFFINEQKDEIFFSLYALILHYIFTKTLENIKS